MSSILKALRKIEEEKRTAAHIAPDLRTDQGISPPKSKSWLPLLVGACVGGLVAGAFFWLSYHEGGAAPRATEHAPQNVAEQQQVIKPHADVNVPTVTLPPEPVAADTTLTIPTEKNSSASTITQTRPVPAKQPKPEQLRKSALPVKVRAAVETASVTKPPVIKPSVAETFNVSEIFYQDDPQNSMAVVNDLPVMVGTQVDSAVVQEIHPDHVVFDVDGQKFSVKARPQP